jgi:putative flippase GtrA
MRLPSWSLLRYLVVGLVNTSVGLTVIFLCKGLFGFGDIVANAVGYGIGIVVSFAMNKRWTFAFDGAAMPALARFLGVVVLAYLANLSVVLLLIALGADAFLAQTLGILPYTLVGYAGSRFFVFTEIHSAAQCGAQLDCGRCESDQR